jgi:hypothetical protein
LARRGGGLIEGVEHRRLAHDVVIAAGFEHDAFEAVEGERVRGLTAGRPGPDDDDVVLRLALSAGIMAWMGPLLAWRVGIMGAPDNAGNFVCFVELIAQWQSGACVPPGVVDAAWRGSYAREVASDVAKRPTQIFAIIDVCKFILINWLCLDYLLKNGRNGKNIGETWVGRVARGPDSVLKMGVLMRP